MREDWPYTENECMLLDIYASYAKPFMASRQTRNKCVNPSETLVQPKNIGHILKYSRMQTDNKCQSKLNYTNIYACIQDVIVSF